MTCRAPKISSEADSASRCRPVKRMAHHWSIASSPFQQLVQLVQPLYYWSESRPGFRFTLRFRKVYHGGAGCVAVIPYMYGKQDLVARDVGCSEGQGKRGGWVGLR